MAAPKKKDSKAPKRKGQAKASSGRLGSISQYFRDVRLEFRKVIWPTRPEVGSQAMVVLTTLLFFTVLIGVLDYIFSSVVGLVIQ